MLFTLVILSFFSSCLYGANKDVHAKVQKKSDKKTSDEKKSDDPRPPSIGNFSLGSSQQPSSLLGFGQHIFDKGQTQIFLTADDFIGKRKYFVDVIPGVVYAIRDDLSV